MFRIVIFAVFSLAAFRCGAEDEPGQITNSKSEQANVHESLNVKLLGALGDGKTDDAPALQKAIDLSIIEQKKVVVPPGIYRIGKTLVKPQSFTGLEMCGLAGTVTFDYSALPENTSCLKIIGGSGALCKATIEGIRFKGNATSVAVEIDGQCGQMVRKCNFQANSVGLLFHNASDGSFTEWCTAEECEWEDSCRIAVEYKRSKGHMSFHGSGLIKMNWVNTKGGGGNPVILINNDCLPYNAPLFLQVWHSADATLIDNRNGPPSNYTPYFYGNLTSESFKGVYTLGKGTRILFTGPIQSLGDYTDAGNLLPCEKVVYKDGAAIPMGVKWSTIRELAPGTNTIETFARGGTYWVNVYLQGAEYDYRYVLLIGSDGFGADGTVTQIANMKSFNGAGFDAPTFLCDKEGRLQIINPKFPATGVKAHLSYKQAGDWIEGNSPAKLF